jgi:hypothetical protein
LVKVKLPRIVGEERVGPVGLGLEIAFPGIMEPGLIMILVGIQEDSGTEQDIGEEEHNHQEQEAYYEE